MMGIEKPDVDVLKQQIECLSDMTETEVRRYEFDMLKSVIDLLNHVLHWAEVDDKVTDEMVAELERHDPLGGVL
jgi:hypothetical protein